MQRAVKELDLVQMRKFMIPIIQSVIAEREPLAYLNEMRRIAVAFVNVVVVNVSKLVLVNLCDKIFRKIRRISAFYYGTLNKVTLFDKDMMFLIIFGLRGNKVRGLNNI